MLVFKSQFGLAPIIIVAGLLLAGAIAVAGYFVINQNKADPEAFQPELTPMMVDKSTIVTQTPSPLPPIEEIKEKHEESLLNMEGVENVEVGEKDGKPCIVVFSFEETDELQNLEETGLDGYQVKIENASR